MSRSVKKLFNRIEDLMVGFAFIFTITILFAIFVSLFKSCEEANREYRYCGNVVRKYTKNCGNKYCHYGVVFYNDSLKKDIDVIVTEDTYRRTNTNDRICFDLYKSEVN